MLGKITRNIKKKPFGLLTSDQSNKDRLELFAFQCGFYRRYEHIEPGYERVALFIGIILFIRHEKYILAVLKITYVPGIDTKPVICRRSQQKGPSVP